MRTISILILAIGVICCQPKNDNIQTLSDLEWYENILPIAFPFGKIKGDSIFLYKNYENKEIADTISFLYHVNAENMGYKINDSIVNYIINRENKVINNRLDTMSLFNIQYISDTSNIKHDYVLLSEPFFIDDEIVYLSLSSKKINTNKREHLIFCIKKQNMSTQIVSIYDVGKDALYENAEP